MKLTELPYHTVYGIRGAIVYARYGHEIIFTCTPSPNGEVIPGRAALNEIIRSLLTHEHVGGYAARDLRFIELRTSVSHPEECGRGIYELMDINVRYAVEDHHMVALNAHYAQKNQKVIAQFKQDFQAFIGSSSPIPLSREHPTTRALRVINECMQVQLPAHN